MIPAHKKRRLERQRYFSNVDHLLNMMKGLRKKDCPHCHSLHIVKNGKYKDRQRYKCRDCSRTFNDLTDTPLHGTKHFQKWLKFLECMIYGYSLRLTAIKVGVSWVTIFYWRHKILKALQVVENDTRLDPFLPNKSYPYICVRQAPPLYAVYRDERAAFKVWIQSFDWIAQKYIKRYISWFRIIQKTESLLGMEKRMKQLLVLSSSISLKQTYKNVSLTA